MNCYHYQLFLIVGHHLRPTTMIRLSFINSSIKRFLLLPSYWCRYLRTVSRSNDKSLLRDELQQHLHELFVLVAEMDALEFFVQLWRMNLDIPFEGETIRLIKEKRSLRAAHRAAFRLHRGSEKIIWRLLKKSRNKTDRYLCRRYELELFAENGDYASYRQLLESKRKWRYRLLCATAGCARDLPFVINLLEENKKLYLSPIIADLYHRGRLELIDEVMAVGIEQYYLYNVPLHYLLSCPHPDSVRRLIVLHGLTATTRKEILIDNVNYIWSMRNNYTFLPPTEFLDLIGVVHPSIPQQFYLPRLLRDIQRDGYNYLHSLFLEKLKQQ